MTSKRKSIPLPEHPRPDWERADWINLNGEWDFGFAANAYDQKINVPFGWGSRLSGVENKGDDGYYRREITIPKSWKGKRVFVVVGASDHDTDCVFAGHRLGRHIGGYTPFEFEMTSYVEFGKKQTLEFHVWDPDNATASNGHYLFGKQGYGNVRGIWQTVYLEARAMDYLEIVHFTPHLATSTVTAAIRLAAPAKTPLVAAIEIDGKVTSAGFAPGEMTKDVGIRLRSPRLWSLDDPNLYDVTVTLSPKAGRGAKENASASDVVRTYFGFREIGVGKNPNGDPYVTLNGKPIYLQVTLDQSYNPDGFYTFPTDEFMRNEILISKNLALQGNRVHIKVEVPRKLYWADKLGLLIQADVPCAWGDPTEELFEEHWKCFEGMVKRDYNHPCIYQWTLFNETWGLFTNRSLKLGLASGANGEKREYREATQRKVSEAYFKAKALDATRLVEDNSPCHGNHVITDVNTWHCYLPGNAWEERVAKAVKENYPGSTFDFVDGFVQRGEPMMNSECGDVWGYPGPLGDIDLTWDYHLMIDAFRRHLRCGGFVYTEHHDVINEWNGYVRYDRTAKEFGVSDLFPGMDFKDLHAKAYIALSENLWNAAPAGGSVKIPVTLSLVTDEFAGTKPSLQYALRYHDAKGELVEEEPVQVGGIRIKSLASWDNRRLAEVTVRLPKSTAAGTINFTLLADGKPIARNFSVFSTVDPSVASAAPSASSWSVKEWDVMDGKKRCGAGTGFFEYTFDAPDGGVFRAEVSSKRLNGKDVKGLQLEGIDWMLGGGTIDRSASDNSYPQTTAAHKHPGKVKVFANGTLVKTVQLPDDPADHRGILSWGAQGKGRGHHLHEAGSYGYIVAAKIPRKLVKDGKVTIRLAAEETGLAVFSNDFGRYPFGPQLTQD